MMLMNMKNKCIVSVRFTSGPKEYEYIAEGSQEELAEFPFAVVDSPSTGYCVVEVMGVKNAYDYTYNGTMKFVVAMFSDKSYKELKEKRARLVNVEKLLEELAARQNKFALLEVLADKDDDIKSLLDELKAGL